MAKLEKSFHADDQSITTENLMLFRLLFVAREDAHAVWRGSQPVAVREPLTNDVLRAHLAGECRVGTYLIQLDGRTPFLVLDVDVQKRSLIRRILKRLQKKEVVAYVERSKSKGYHIWIFFDKPVRAAQARMFAAHVLRGLETRKIEIFPKQDKVAEDCLGNCIWMPLFGRDTNKERTVFLDDDLEPARDQWHFLRRVKRASKKRITHICEGLQPPAIEQSPRLQEHGAGSGPTLPLCAQTILFKGVEDGHRNKALFTLAKHLRNAGLNEQRVAELLNNANEQCLPPLEVREIASIVKSVFAKGYTSLDCEDSFIASLCGEECPIRRNEGNAGGRQSAATKLANLAKDVTLFHTHDKEAYGTMQVNEHQETCRLKDQVFKRWLAAKAYEQMGAAPSSQALNDAVGVLEGMALHGGPEQEVFTRVAEHEGRIYLDLCNPTWDVVKISGKGWKIVSDPPIKFRRARGMKPLPTPKPGGSIAELRNFLNLATDLDFTLVVSWLVAALRPRGPYPVLVLQGEAGSAKSTSGRVVRELIDPNTTPLRAEPRETRDLMIAANNAWCIAFDNVSHLSWRLSDDLCRLATGGGFSTRQLYTDAEETLFEAKRPLILNGIDGVVSRGDLLDRSLVVYQPVIVEGKRRAEKQFWQDFRAAQPLILGALLDAVSCALRRVESVKLPRLPRMADFAQWVVAAEPALGWAEGTFLMAYDANRRSTNTLALEASLIVRALQRVCAGAHSFKGTATQLLRKLGEHADALDTTQKFWPKDAWTLSKQLRSIAPNLRASGLDVNFGEKTAGSGSKRIIRIKRIGAKEPEAFAEGFKGKDGIWRFPFPRTAKKESADSSSSDAD